jgi:tetratricopeptide (TPR) repeat protein
MAVTAPAMALLYDRTFLAGTFKRALSLRRGFYIGLAASWIWLGVLLAFNGRGATVGMDQGILPLDYARTQLNVIAHYIFLAVWPRHLMLDEYGWPIARKWAEVGWGGWLVLLLAVATAVALWRRPRLGFLGAWFFVILSPSSSFVPIVTEIAAERRMYLPLAAIVALGVIGVWRATGRRLILTGLAASAVIIVLAATTLLRNEEYKSVAGIWGSVLQHNPGNPRAHLNIGEALATDGKPIDAANEYCLALECNPKFFIAASELGRLLMRTGNVDLAEQFYAHQKKSPSAMVGAARFIRGMMLAEQQRWSEAEGDFRKAANQLPGDPDVNYNFGVALQQLGQWKGAQYEFEMTLKADKNYRDAEARLAVVEAALKKSTAAGEH